MAQYVLRRSTVDRLLARTVLDEATGCWVWMGSRNESGYGYIGEQRSGRGLRVHRLSYEHFVGAIPDGLHLDHLCENKACLNPDHLEPVTNSENCRRYRERHPGGRRRPLALSSS